MYLSYDDINNVSNLNLYVYIFGNREDRDH